MYVLREVGSGMLVGIEVGHCAAGDGRRVRFIAVLLSANLILVRV